MAPLIGISSNFFHPAPDRLLFKNKRLIYHEQSLAARVWEAGGVPIGLSEVEDKKCADQVVEKIDGLLLGGGADVSPETYQASLGKWPGDRYHDKHELALIEAARKQKRAILGICRGHQILNVAFGGTLHEDLESKGLVQKPHRSQELYDKLFHEVNVESTSRLAGILGVTTGKVVSVHHQGIDQLGSGLKCVAKSKDGIIEAVETDVQTFVMGVQWHPEWTPSDEGFISGSKLFEAFIKAAKRSS